MIISNKYKYIFIGLPYSASTSISSYLIENCSGDLILGKHSNMPHLLLKREKFLIAPLDEYAIFGVYRDPLQLAHTGYTKLKNDPYNLYNSQNNQKWVRKKAHKLSRIINKRNLNFQQYIEYRYNHLYFDWAFTLNKNYFTDILNFNNLANDMEKLLQKLKIPCAKKLPIINKTLNKELYDLDLDLKSRIFDPFLKDTGQIIEHVAYSRMLKYKTIQKFRHMSWHIRDMRTKNDKYTTDFNIFEDK